MASNLGSLNKQILLKLLLLAVLMFGFGYALVPLYKALCEVTGINVITSKNNYGVRAHGASKPGNTQVDYSRKITIEFDSNSKDRAIAAQAIPSYAPKAATEFFTKIECFCFQEQALNPHQIRQMPVVFIVDPNLPKDVKTITLSYTFFETGIAKPVALTQPSKASGS